MPDHLHWLLQLDGENHLSQVVRSIKSLSSHRIGFPVWQRGFHDRAICKDEDVVSIARYMIGNPLRAGLVKTIGNYPHWDAVWF
jgi:REP element-mobilizing transposase RayT